MVKNCFIIITDPKNLNNGPREWPSSNIEAALALRNCASFYSLESVLETTEFSEIVVKSVTDWSFSEFVCSALTSTFLDEDEKVSVYGWSVITQILMNSYLSDDVLFFLKKNSFYGKGIKKDIIKAVNFCFHLKDFRFGNEKCVRNVLIFLEIDKDDIEALLKDFSFKTSLKPINNYILSLTKEPD